MRGKRSRDAFLSLMIVLQAPEQRGQVVEHLVDAVRDLRCQRVGTAGDGGPFFASVCALVALFWEIALTL